MDPIGHFEGNLPILSTCRQIYTEARLLPFKLNTIVGQADDLIKLMLSTFKTWQLTAVIELKVQVNRYQLLTKNNNMREPLVPNSVFGGVARYRAAGFGEL
jgi:hypothetical protein